MRRTCIREASETSSCSDENYDALTTKGKGFHLDMDELITDSVRKPSTTFN
jgi:hypothetical protein